jgi:hypothetical protein
LARLPSGLLAPLLHLVPRWMFPSDVSRYRVAILTNNGLGAAIQPPITVNTARIFLSTACFSRTVAHPTRRSSARMTGISRPCEQALVVGRGTAHPFIDQVTAHHLIRKVRRSCELALQHTIKSMSNSDTPPCHAVT